MDNSQIVCGSFTNIGNVQYQMPKQVKAALQTPVLDVNRAHPETMEHWFPSRNMGRAQDVGRFDRDELRNKVRYEFMNNEFVYGIATKFALAAVGNGPRLDVSIDHLIPTASDKIVNAKAKDFCDYVARTFRWWATSIRYFIEQYKAAINIAIDGEHLGVILPNPRNDYCPFTYRSIDTARLRNPENRLNTEFMKDGILYDKYGNPEAYCILDNPEHEYANYDPGKYTIIPASQVVYFFMPTFAEQLRGFATLTPSLQRIGRFRDYDQYTLEGAKQASRIVGVIETQAGYGNFGTQMDNIEKCPYVPGSPLYFDANQWIQLPPMTQSKVFDPKPSNTNYKEFSDSNLQMAAMPLHMGKNRATGSSADYNYSSAKMDDQITDAFISFYRTLADTQMNDRLFKTFYTHNLADYYQKFDWTLVPEYKELEKRWRYPVAKVLDEVARENAWDTAIKNGTMTRKEVIENRNNYANWSDTVDQINTEAEINQLLQFEDTSNGENPNNTLQPAPYPR